MSILGARHTVVGPPTQGHLMLLRRRDCKCPQPPRFEFYDPHSPIYTSPRFLPPAKIVKCKVSDAIVSHGAYLEEDSIVENAIIGLRSRIGRGVTIRVPPYPPPLSAPRSLHPLPLRPPSFRCCC